MGNVSGLPDFDKEKSKDVSGFAASILIFRWLMLNMDNVFTRGLFGHLAL